MPEQEYEFAPARYDASDLRQGAASLQAAAALKERAAADLAATAKAQAAIADATANLQDFVESSSRTLREVREEIEAHRQLSEEVVDELERRQRELEEAYQSAIDAVQARLGGALGRIARGYDGPDVPAMSVSVSPAGDAPADKAEAVRASEQAGPRVAGAGQAAATPAADAARAQAEPVGAQDPAAESDELPAVPWMDNGAVVAEGSDEPDQGAPDASATVRDAGGQEPEREPEQPTGFIDRAAVEEAAHRQTSMAMLDDMLMGPLGAADDLEEVDGIGQAPLPAHYPIDDGMRALAASPLSDDAIRANVPDPAKAEAIIGLRA